MDTLLSTWVISSAAISLSLSSPHGLHGTVVGGQGVVEGDLIVVQAEGFTALGGSIEFLGQFDQLFDHLGRGDGTVVVCIESLLELLGKHLSLHKIALGAHPDLVFQQLLEQLCRHVLVLKAALCRFGGLIRLLTSALIASL